jgi:hypothetical protein
MNAIAFLDGLWGFLAIVFVVLCLRCHLALHSGAPPAEAAPDSEKNWLFRICYDILVQNNACKAYLARLIGI